MRTHPEINKLRNKGIAIPAVTTLPEAADIAADHYRQHWAGADQKQWFLRFTQEVGELAGVLAGDHDDTVEVELIELYSILKNWIRRREEGTIV